MPSAPAAVCQCHMSHQETDGILLPGWKSPLSILSSPFLSSSSFSLCVCVNGEEDREQGEGLLAF